VLSSGYAALLDDIQQKHREGPGLRALRHGEAVLVTNIATDGRWPRCRQEALTSTPVRSVLSLPMLSDTGRLGALTAFAEKAEAFDATSGNVATVYAALGALAWGTVVLQRQMPAAVQSRDVIRQAKGMRMERHKIDAQQAFDMLRKRSRSSNAPVRIVAGELAAVGSWAETHSYGAASVFGLLMSLNGRLLALRSVFVRLH
jgi:transcriptional regulator with GAF, ATPase, and Fis domain